MLSPSPDARFEALLAAEADGRDLPPFLAFWGHTAKADHAGPWVLSQWWPTPFQVDGVTYRHAESFMMAAKARLFDDSDMLEQILASEHPGEAKKLGRQVQGFDEAVWQTQCYAIVVAANVAKFAQSTSLRAYLLSTAPQVLVEASPRDRIWGVGLGPDNPKVNTPSQWRGRNLLGFALTEVRERLSASEGDRRG